MKTLFAFLGLLVLSVSSYAQQNEQEKDSLQKVPIALDEVLVSAVRVTSQSPVTFSNLQKKDVASRNLGQDIPVLMNYLPSVVTTTDAGAGVGYTSLRVRGSDATRINVTINGIPYNDAESQGTFWVNMPDFVSSVENLQLQRGIGTSTNGAAAFGASLNLLTDAISESAYGEITNSYGSFNTHKHTAKFSTGMLNDHFEFAGRLSTIKSDGYIDRAASDLDSYFLQASYVDDNTLLKALLFGGHEITYQAWNGIDPETLATNRRFNSAGMYFDEDGNMKFYDNEVDNYKQDHFQLLWNEQISDAWSTNIALHYTRGRGFFEQYKEDKDFAEYGLEPIVVGGEEINTTDLVQRRWLVNNFYGTTFSATYKNKKTEIIIGGAYNKYEGDHFGEVIWARYASNSEIRSRYYEDDSEKTDFNIYTKANYRLSDKLSLFADMQYRTVGYSANGNETGLVDDTFDFFNPKAGLTYTFNNHNHVYFSYARASREPNRNDYENGNPKPEKLNDFELGWRYTTPNTKINTNLYYMRYKDQLVLTGELNDVGAPLRANSGDSFRFGLEADATLYLSDKWILRPNVAISANKNIDFYFQRDGVLEDLGNTNISYSPDFVAGNIITYIPVSNLSVSFLSKYVSEQYMGNIDAPLSKLDSYFVNDLNIQYEIKTKSIFKSIILSGLVNNLFDEEYISNGYFYTYDDNYTNPGTITTVEGVGYYPQAGINFLAGVTFKF